MMFVIVLTNAHVDCKQENESANEEITPRREERGMTGRHMIKTGVTGCYLLKEGKSQQNGMYGC